MNDDQLFTAGVVTGIHGLRGDLKVRALSGDSSAIDSVTTITLKQGQSSSLHNVTKIKRHKGLFLVKLEAIDSAESAQTFIGSDVLISRDSLSELEDDEFYWYQLEGLNVVDDRLGPLGQVVDIFTTPAHDILVVNGDRGEILVPVVDEFIRSVDNELKIMHVDLPEGLVPGKDSHAL